VDVKPVQGFNALKTTEREMMMRMIAANGLDSTDEQIMRLLKENKEGCKIGLIVQAANKSESATRYRLLTLEALGLVKAIRERGSTIYTVSDN
jgi:DNA-binding transcriptional ArsR family regulator